MLRHMMPIIAAAEPWRCRWRYADTPHFHYRRAAVYCYAAAAATLQRYATARHDAATPRCHVTSVDDICCRQPPRDTLRYCYVTI